MAKEYIFDKQERHANWKSENMSVLCSSGLAWRSTNGGENLCFPAKGKTFVQFYPSTGRWYVPSQDRTFRGMATAFVAWYRKQSQREQS